MSIYVGLYCSLEIRNAINKMTKEKVKGRGNIDRLIFEI